MKDWLERNIRGSLGAEGIFQGGRHDLPSGPEKGEDQDKIPPIWEDPVYGRSKGLDTIDLADLSTSLMESETMEHFIDVLSNELKNMIDFDVGTIRWKPMDLNYDESSLEFQEDDLPEYRDFSARSNIVIGDDPVCADMDIDPAMGTRFLDCFQGSYRAKTPIGDPVLIHLRSMIYVPLLYRSELIGTLQLFSAKERVSGEYQRKLMDPIWRMISASLGKVLRLEAMKRERDRSRDLLDSTDDILVVWRNRDSVWEIDCNRKAEELIDLKDISPDMLDGPFFVPPGKEWERAVLAWDSTFDSGEPHQMDLHIKDRNGIDRSFLCKFRPFMEGENISGVRMTGVEMETLDDGIRQLESTNRTYRLLLSVLSHDLKNPLSAIMGYNELMEYSDDDRRKEYSKKIYSLIKRMTDTITMTNTFSQLQEGRISKEFEEIDIKEMVNNCLELLYPKTEDHEIRVSFADSDHRIKGHRILEQVVLNLLDNAMKYSEKGSDIEISLSAGVEGLTLAVSDKGIGIKDIHKTTIFERFNRSVGGTGIRGAGLGLAISKGITELHQGRIWVEDNPGGGSVFNVFLPWDQEPSSG